MHMVVTIGPTPVRRSNPEFFKGKEFPFPFIGEYLLSLFSDPKWANAAKKCKGPPLSDMYQEKGSEAYRKKKKKTTREEYYKNMEEIYKNKKKYDERD